MFVTPPEWRPQGINSLDPIAEEVVRNSTNNILVTAGPGAGKSELLAQKASYLLQTNLCPDPYRILAISFKVDAANNIRDRVNLRCGDKLSNRFDSYTFSSFTKSILDRFKLGLPNNYTPTHDYSIDPSILYERNIRDTLSRINHPHLTEEKLQNTNLNNFENRFLKSHPIPISSKTTWEGFLARAAWHYFINISRPSVLSYSMIDLLAELIINNNPYIKKALQATYKFVFIDEFQDTTDFQYNFTINCFLNSATITTAVGDKNQSIMTWAGARGTIFEDFTNDFYAEEKRLRINYRSAPNLVSIQHKIICHLEGCDVDQIQPFNASLPGECFAYEYESHEQEAMHLTELIHSFLHEESIPHREICILARNRPPHYASVLIEQLKEVGIQARIETEMQDILSEPVTKLILSFMKLLVLKASPEDWLYLKDFIIESASHHNEYSERDIESQLDKSLKNIKQNIQSLIEENTIDQLIEVLLETITPTALVNQYPQYAQGHLLSETVDNITGHFNKLLEEYTLKEAIAEFEGINSIPIMTIHKSKGLEYNTVIFIGLEDSAFWNFRNSQTEETRSFFVAFSRAKQRVIFTMSKKRPNNWGQVANQTTNQIDKLYELLDSAGIRRELIVTE